MQPRAAQSLRGYVSSPPKSHVNISTVIRATFSRFSFGPPKYAVLLIFAYCSTYPNSMAFVLLPKAAFPRVSRDASLTKCPASTEMQDFVSNCWEVNASHLLQREHLIEFRSPAFALLWFLLPLLRKEEYFDPPEEDRTARMRVKSLLSTGLVDAIERSVSE